MPASEAAENGSREVAKPPLCPLCLRRGVVSPLVRNNSFYEHATTVRARDCHVTRWARDAIEGRRVERGESTA